MISADRSASERSPDHVPVSVAICTRNRGQQLVRTIESVLASSCASFELLIVDQSDSDETLRAVQPFLADERVRYLHPSDTGLSRARNLALREVRSEFVLFTDDDCVVDREWITANLAALEGRDGPTIVFGDVVSPPDDQPGYAPESVADRDVMIRSVRQWRAPDGVNIGIGASMAVRRSKIRALGGFDELLGAGGEMISAEDTDISLRAITAGYPVMRIRDARVVHYGSRPHEDFRVLTRGAMFGVGAVIGKLIRVHPAAVAWFAVGTYWRLVVAPACSHLARLERPPVLGRAVYLTRGMWRGFRTPLDRPTGRFRVRDRIR